MAAKRVKPATNRQKQKYVDYLAEGEEIVAAFGIGNRYFWYNIVSLVLLAILVILFPLLYFSLIAPEVIVDHPVLIFVPGIVTIILIFPIILKLVHLKHSKTYLLTDRRVLIKDGVFSIKITTAPYDKITHITVQEDFLKKISYQIGDITIHTAGPTPVEIDLLKVQYPMRVKNLIEELMLKERSLLGTTSEESVVRPLA